jgi:hypothetical protein
MIWVIFLLLLIFKELRTIVVVMAMVNCSQSNASCSTSKSSGQGVGVAPIVLFLNVRIFIATFRRIMHGDFAAMLIQFIFLAVELLITRLTMKTQVST